MVPFVDCETPAQERHNVSHKRTRNKVERSIGVLKSRFRCLCKECGGSILFDKTSACEIIVSCIVLHNYCMDRNFPRTVGTKEERTWQESEVQAEGHTLSLFGNQKTVRGMLARQNIVEEKFT